MCAFGEDFGGAEARARNEAECGEMFCRLGE